MPGAGSFVFNLISTGGQRVFVEQLSLACEMSEMLINPSNHLAIRTITGPYTYLQK